MLGFGAECSKQLTKLKNDKKLVECVLRLRMSEDEAGLIFKSSERFGGAFLELEFVGYQQDGNLLVLALAKSCFWMNRRCRYWRGR